MIGGRITSDYVTKGGASITGTNSLLYFIYDNSGLPIGFEVSNSTTYPTGVYTYQKNLQGDVIGVVDSDGNQVASYSYDAWGNIISQSGTLADINPIRYKGYYYDSDIGMYYLQSRYYDPALRRFINADDPSLVIGLSKSSVFGINLFGYCDNNGVNDSDPNGYMSSGAIALSFGAKYGIGLAGHALLVKMTAFIVAVMPYLLIGIAVIVAVIIGIYIANVIIVKKIIKSLPKKIKKGDKVDLSKFKIRISRNYGKGWKGPDGWEIIKDTAHHAGSAWKLYKLGKKIATLWGDGRVRGK